MFDGRSREDWEAELQEQSEWIVRHFLCTCALLGIPRTMLDVGCGLGAIIEAARSLGVTAFGVDQLAETRGHYFYANLVDKFDLGTQVNMVWCTEVAEHLDQSAHATLCDTLTDNLEEGRGNYLIFSAAFPNQGGSGHIAERPAKYWLDQFATRKLGYRKDLTVNLSLLWSNIGSPLYWLPTNVMVLEK